ncbi:hypothetical protein JW968_06710 [Candidatus Woesearchaeota archaeon]|nr:hypothetical protein [Candidatus Woesearchaeota archaeon]
MASNQSNPVIDLALETIRMGKQALVFVNTRPSAEKTAEDISKKLKDDEKAILLAEKALKALQKPTRQCERLSNIMRKAIAFHHAGLHPKQRELIEDSFKAGDVRIICCTPTLAQGVDLPAFRSIIRDLKRYGGPWGLSYIPVLEYEQMAGRAGRPKFDEYGEAIIIAGSEGEKEEIYDRYICGEPEDIYSKLAVEPVLRTYLLSLISSNFVNSKKQIMDFFEKTYWAYQYRDMDRMDVIISKMLDLLEDWEFIISEGDDFVSADKVDDRGYRATLVGNRVAELYLDPLTAHMLIESLRTAASKRFSDFSFLHMISSTLEIRPPLRVKSKEFDMVQSRFLKYEDQLIAEEPSSFDPDYGQFISTVKTALFFVGWIDELDEEALLEQFDIRPGEIRSKLDIADWLLYSSEELAKLMQFRELFGHLMKLRLRVKHGIREELLNLVRFRGIGRVRARILFRNGIRDVAEIRRADLSTLSSLVGRRTAESLKEQVGQKLEPVRSGKRRGQKSVRDY